MGGMDLTELLSHLVIYMVVFVLAICAHEAGHAWMSHKFGDDTAKDLGRVTLNPVAHTDPIGTLLIPILSFIFGIPVSSSSRPRKWSRPPRLKSSVLSGCGKT